MDSERLAYNDSYSSSLSLSVPDGDAATVSSGLHTRVSLTDAVRTKRLDLGREPPEFALQLFDRVYLEARLQNVDL